MLPDVDYKKWKSCMTAAKIRQSDLFELLASQLKETISLLDKMATEVQKTVSGKIEINAALSGTPAGQNLIIALQAEDRIRQRLEAAVRACEVGSSAGEETGASISVEVLQNALGLSELIRDLNLDKQHTEDGDEIELF